MKTSSLRVLLLALLVGVPFALRADVVFLKSGGKMEGRIVERSDSSVEIDIGAGKLTFPMSAVEHIEEGRSALDDFDQRAEALRADDGDGWLELARWASGAGLGAQAKQAYEHVLTIDPSNAEANRAMGRVELEGRWVTEEQAYRARGYVWFEGEWMRPSERESILRNREAAAAAAEAQVRSAEAQARVAEARAQEAEARAQEAEARAQRVAYARPIYWGTWGLGPRTWPTNPLDRRPAPLSGRTLGRP